MSLFGRLGEQSLEHDWIEYAADVTIDSFIGDNQSEYSHLDERVNLAACFRHSAPAFSQITLNQMHNPIVIFPK